MMEEIVFWVASCILLCGYVLVLLSMAVCVHRTARETEKDAKVLLETFKKTDALLDSIKNAKGWTNERDISIQYCPYCQDWHEVEKRNRVRSGPHYGKVCREDYYYCSLAHKEFVTPHLHKENQIRYEHYREDIRLTEAGYGLI